MTFVSYAQNYEDVILWRAFKDINAGFYIDVGAAWPDTHSVTKAFYQQNWRGINIEPNPEFASLLREQRERDVNIQKALSDQPGHVDLWLIKGTGLSTLDSEIANQHDENEFQVDTQKTEVTTLEAIWAEFVPKGQQVHFLKVDVEGFEQKVLRGNNWKKYRPWVVIIEATLPLSQEKSYSASELILVEADYYYAYSDGLNRFYIAKEHMDLSPAFKYPPNVFDDFVLNVQQEAENRAIEAEYRANEAECRANEAECRANEAECRANEAECRANSYEQSLSWRLTYPLRALNPKRLLGYVLRNLGKWAINNPRFAYVIKPALKKFPTLWVNLKRNALYYSRPNSDNVDYISLSFEHFDVLFSKGPLVDRRGIGRVSKELLSQFISLSNPNIKKIDTESTDNRKYLYFYSSIHWCPDHLPNRSIVMIHDVIPMLFPDLFPEESNEWVTHYKPIAQQAEIVVTISNSSARDISKLLEIPLKRIHVVFNGISILPVGEDCRISLPKDPYLLFLGSHDKHKNAEIILKALQDPTINDIPLVFIGDNKNLIGQVKYLNLNDRVHFLGRVNDSEVGFVISKAKALVFPSYYEGFGLPPLEAALLGTPSICSKRPAMTEFMDGAALFADPQSPREWVDAIKRLDDSELREKLIHNAMTRAKEFTWEKSARGHIEVFNKAIINKTDAPN